MARVTDLASLNSEELKQFLDSFDTIVSDCDGVLVYHEKAIPGAVDCIETLRRLGKKIIFVSNNGTSTLKDSYSKLERAGFKLSDGDLINPTIVGLDYLKKIGFNKKIYLFSFDGLKKELEAAGYQIIDTEKINPQGMKLVPLFQEMLNLDPEVGAVYFDVNFTYNYLTLQQAVQYLLKPDVVLFASAEDKTLPIAKGINVIGPAFVLDIFTTMTGKKPIVFGKPSEYIHEYIKSKISSPSRTLIIGDSMAQDIYLANRYGYKSLLVLSGVTKQSTLEACEDKNLIPDYYLQDLKLLNTLIQSNSKM